MAVSKKVITYVENIKKETFTKDEIHDLICILHLLYKDDDTMWYKEIKEQFFGFYSEEDEIYDKL